ncbi:MAG: hypothetical protein PHV57_07150 [Methanomicrobiaceae archaeon]|nr:hypothetical protein [Methanomicrobiaceae archaeon]
MEKTNPFHLRDLQPGSEVDLLWYALDPSPMHEQRAQVLAYRN